MKKVLLFIGLLAVCGVNAQVVINPQLPPLGLTIKPQLWNVSLINTTGQNMNVQLQMVMTDAATSQAVLSGASPTFTIPAGVKLVTANDVSPVTYNNGTGYTIDPSPAGFLPVGVYNICYTVTRWNKDIPEQIAEECVTAAVEPITPPQLVQPADSDRVLLRRPFFTWLPPTPHNSFSSLLYDWSLVEVQATQSAADAIQQNIPVLLQSNISFTSFQYPLSMAELDSTRLYAWRVIAKNNGMPVANSEIWCFRIQPFTNDTIKKPSSGTYAALRRTHDASYVISNGLLRYQYQHEINSNSIQFRITDITNANQTAIQLDSNLSAVKYGSNYITLDLTDKVGMIDRHMYLLEVTNAVNERWYLKFEYRKLPQ
ncbi:hypothetical protein [Longitalea luteola]|uniref:hypothetical protein n=1 Tax=Longitalea luteola TaxID=2812563 RepID=UPI001A97587A|nr:hypothetical protein [Longitalea luteola]